MGIDQILNFLGLAMRAGKVRADKSVIVNEIKEGNLKLVIVANDASGNTAKLITDKCKSCKIPFRKFENRNELGIALEKGERVNVGITDPGFAKKLLSMIDKYHRGRLYE